MPRNLPLWYAYSKCRGRLLWNALAVVGAVDIHLAAAIGAIKQASIKMLCPGWGKLAKAAATRPSLI